MRTERLLVSLLLLGPAAASAYTLTGVTWSWQDHPVEDPFLLDTGSFPSDEVSGPDVESAITSAMSSWNDAGLDLTLDYGGRISDGVMVTDGFFNIFYTDSYAGASEGALAFAATWSTVDYDAVDCDIVFLGENSYGDITWSADSGGAGSGEYDVEAVALHELGHCIGLDHSSSSSAVMYAYYQSYRELTEDDLDGAAALYAAPCTDGDGDGYTDCDFDCDDDNAAIHPGAAEVCDGVDDNCDGIIDSEESVTVAIGDVGLYGGSGWAAFGNAVTLAHDTVLTGISQKMSADEGSRLAWSVYVADTSHGPYTLVLTEISSATTDSWQHSPALSVPLEVGKVYQISLGVMADDQTYWYDASPDLSEQDGLTPLGSVFGVAMGSDNHGIDANYLFPQELTLRSAADPDDDGQTGLCGDCDEDSDGVYTGAEEVCDGLDNDCDGEADEDFATDADGDGVYDCLDPCPDDVSDDSDGDGVCDSDDPCPEDATNTCDDPPVVDTSDPDDDTGPGGTSGDKGGSCTAAPGGLLAALLLLPVLLSRRRQ